MSVFTPLPSHSINRRSGLKFSVPLLMAVNISFYTFVLAIYSSAASSALYFPVSYVKYSNWTGFYVTRVKLGSPPQEFALRVDVVSKIVWVSCYGCTGCPSSSGIPGNKLKFYDPSKSSTASLIGCSNPKCSTLQKGTRKCSNSSSCTYSVQYGQHDGIEGYYVSDTMYTAVVARNLSINFGCSMLQSGSFTDQVFAFDGFLGLGIHGSLLSQLSSAGVPRIFTLCLDESEEDSSFLYFEEFEEADIVYTPLVTSELSYCLNLQRIDVDGRQLEINSSVFTTSDTQGIIVNSGTTAYAYLPDEAYNHFIHAITSSLRPHLVQPVEGYAKSPCYLTQSSIDAVFPTVKLHFNGDAVMTLHPKNYLMLQLVGDNSTSEWCMAWQNNGVGSKTVLGDIALKGKVLVHDLVNHRFGWKEQKCSIHAKFQNGFN